MFLDDKIMISYDRLVITPLSLSLTPLMEEECLEHSIDIDKLHYALMLLN